MKGVPAVGVVLDEVGVEEKKEGRASSRKGQIRRQSPGPLSFSAS